MMSSNEQKVLPGARVFKTVRRRGANRQERRVRRSKDPQTALAHWLSSCEQRFGLDMLVLVGPGGLRLTGRSHPDGDVLAAYIPLLFAANDASSIGIRQQLAAELPQLTDKLLRVGTVTLRGQKCYLCGVGERPGVLRTAIDATQKGIDRILDRR